MSKYTLRIDDERIGKFVGLLDALVKNNEPTASRDEAIKTGAGFLGFEIDTDEVETALDAIDEFLDSLRADFHEPVPGVDLHIGDFEDNPVKILARVEDYVFDAAEPGLTTWVETAWSSIEEAKALYPEQHYIEVSVLDEVLPQEQVVDVPPPTGQELILELEDKNDELASKLFEAEVEIEQLRRRLSLPAGVGL